MQIAIIGAGNVGGALGKGWARSGHVIDYAVPDPSDDKHRVTAEAAGGAGLFSVAPALQRAEAIVLAVPFDAVASALAAAGNIAGRLLTWVRPGWSCHSASTGRPPSMWHRSRQVRRCSKH